ncbi:transposase family protein [Streptomyces microflavus]|uniref:transposase family protein n=1 Tax=Streptomyces microflavus TaxID=1919 RepID=UPI0035DF79B5
MALHCRDIGSRWRRLTAGRQALLALTHLRYGDTYAQLSAGFGMGIATVCRTCRRPSTSWRHALRASRRR